MKLLFFSIISYLLLDNEKQTAYFYAFVGSLKMQKCDM